MLGGVDVTQQMTGGTIGANVALRDGTLPTYQAELDEFSQNMAGQFAAQGLSLFTDPSRNVPAGGGTGPVQSGYVGFASDDPGQPDRAGRRGAGASTATSRSPAARPVRPPSPPTANGPSGFTTLITNILNYALGADAQPGVPQPAANTTGLGATGTLNAPFAAPATLADFAAALYRGAGGDQRQRHHPARHRAGGADLACLPVATQSGVNIDQQMALMIQLQNAYGANAKVMSAVQNMFSGFWQRCHDPRRPPKWPRR